VNDKNVNQKPLRVAIIHTSNHKPEELGNTLESQNITVVAIAELSSQSLCEIEVDNTDAILVDLSENAGQELDMLENLLEESTLPLLFNDNATTQFNISISSSAWGKKLASKLYALVEKSANNAIDSTPLDAVSTDTVVLDPVEEPVPSPAPEIVIPKIAPVPSAEIRVAPKPKTRLQNGPEQVWVLGASLGGPMAVREFLSKLPADLPIAFILAQHIGASHIELLGEQLNRASSLDVKMAKPEYVLCNGDVILAPIEKRILISDEGEIALAPIVNQSIYAPSIDDVITDVANTYQSDAGAIIFSGMGNDGEEGCGTMAELGGVVWAQNAESCVISSMPDCACRTGTVSYSGTPEELADNLIEYVTQKI